MLHLCFSLWLDLRGKPCDSDLDTLLNLYTGVRQKLQAAGLPSPAGQAVAGVLHLAEDIDEDDEEDGGLSLLVLDADGNLLLDGARAGSSIIEKNNLVESIASPGNRYALLGGEDQLTLSMLDAALSETRILEDEFPPYLLVELQSPVGVFSLAQVEASDRVSELLPLGAVLPPDEALWFEALKVPGSGSTAPAPEVSSAPQARGGNTAANSRPRKSTKSRRVVQGGDKGGGEKGGGEKGGGEGGGSKRDGPSRRARRRARGKPQMMSPAGVRRQGAGEWLKAVGRRTAATLLLCGGGSLCLSEVEPAAAAMANVPTRAGHLAAEMGLPVPGLTPAGVAEADLPVGAVLLRVIGQAENQEQMLQRSAALTSEERFEQGLVVGRQQIALSVELVLRNTRLERLPGCAQAVATLNGIRKAAGDGTGALSRKELEQLSERYRAVQAQLRIAFDKLPEAAREEGTRVEGELRAADSRAKSPYWSEGGRFASGRPGVEMHENDVDRRAREAELDRVMKASLEARQQLGQRTGASELNREGLLEALYGGNGAAAASKRPRWTLQ